jgi:hypothetical protein
VELLEQADELCRAGDMLTPAPSEEVRLLRRWFVEQLTAQLLHHASPAPAWAALRAPLTAAGRRRRRSSRQGGDRHAPHPGAVPRAAAVLRHPRQHLRRGIVFFARRQLDLARSFRTPALPVVAGLAVLFCAVLMLDLAWQTWVRFVAWMLPGLLLYLLYGYRHSRLARQAAGAPPRAGSRGSAVGAP